MFFCQLEAARCAGVQIVNNFAADSQASTASTTEYWDGVGMICATRKLGTVSYFPHWK